MGIEGAMAAPLYQTKRILIYAKTYPELSSKHIETVCTAGVLESGDPVRLYPIPFRYLSVDFHKYQWISARISKNQSDNRPESFKIDCDSIQCEAKVPPTNDEWGKRASIVFKNSSWQFDDVESLLEAQASGGTSLGVVSPKAILDVYIQRKSEDEAKSFDEKMRRLRENAEIDKRQLDLFEASVPTEMKTLEFLKSRPKIRWRCASPTCGIHDMQVLDWEIAELQRKEGDAKAIQKLKEICDLDKYATKFYLGNMFLHQGSFTIVGIWYPKRSSGLLFR